MQYCQHDMHKAYKSYHTVHYSTVGTMFKTIQTNTKYFIPGTGDYWTLLILYILVGSFHDQRCIYALHNMQSTVNMNCAVSRDDFGPKSAILSSPCHFIYFSPTHRSCRCMQRWRFKLRKKSICYDEYWWCKHEDGWKYFLFQKDEIKFWLMLAVGSCPVVSENSSEDSVARLQAGDEVLGNILAVSSLVYYQRNMATCRPAKLSSDPFVMQ